MITFLKESEQHQHPNGGGWVANTASVEKTVYVGPNAQVFGNAQVSGNARVSDDAQVSGNAWVFGDAWEQSPLYVQGSKHSVTNSGHNQITIGCQTQDFAYWKKHYRAIGKANGYTKAEIEEYGKILELFFKIGK